MKARDPRQTDAVGSVPLRFEFLSGKTGEAAKFIASAKICTDSFTEPLVLEVSIQFIPQPVPVPLLGVLPNWQKRFEGSVAETLPGRDSPCRKG